MSAKPHPGNHLYVVTYTSRSVIIVEAKTPEEAEQRALRRLTGGVTQPAKRDVVIEKVEAE